MQPIVIEDHGPLLIVRFHSHATEEQYAAYLDEMTALIVRGESKYPGMAVVNDAREWFRSTPGQRKQMAAWVAQNEPMLRRRTAGVAFVITSGVVRGSLTAVLWLTSFPFPYKVFGNLEEATDWAKARIAAHVGNKDAR